MQPARKIESTFVSKEFNEFNINSYLERKTSIKDPLIPGRIIADIAIAPERNIKMLVFGVDDGATKEMYPDKTKPKESKRYDIGVNLFILLKIINAEHNINPKKNPQILKWWLSSRKAINLESIRIDTIIPINRVDKKLPFIWYQKFLN